MLSAALRRPVALLVALLTTAAFFVAVAASRQPASAATIGTDVAATIDATVKIKTGLLGSRVSVLGDLDVPADANVDLTGQKVVLRVNGGNVLCVATTTRSGLIRCDAVVNALVRAQLKRVGAVVAFTGGTVRRVVDGTSVAARADATAIVRALVEI